MSERHGLAELGRVFLLLGLTSFGGPAAHIALMRDEFVRRRGWLDDQAYVDLIGAANLIPGPTSTEVAMHIGHSRAGWAGLVVAGLAFLLPAVAIVAVLAWVYVTYGTQPAVGALLVGIAPVVVAVIAHAGWSIGRTAVRTSLAAVVAAAAAVGSLARVSEIALLLGLGAVVALTRVVAPRVRGAGAAMALPLGGWTPGGWPPPGGMLRSPWPADLVVAVYAVGPAIASPLAVFGEFLKIGSVLFGSGYLLVALLRAELVEGLAWISETQLIDAIAVGQATPGPLFSTATFVGYLVAGPAGAAAATVGIFLPAFVAVAISIPLLSRLRRSATFRGFLDGVNAAAVGLLAVVAVQLAIGVLVDPLAVAVAVAAFALLVRGVGTVWLIAGGAAVGIARWLLLPT